MNLLVRTGECAVCRPTCGHARQFTVNVDMVRRMCHRHLFLGIELGLEPSSSGATSSTVNCMALLDLSLVLALDNTRVHLDANVDLSQIMKYRSS